jgi:tetratricopeptide (TPR) repeat protein
MREARRADDERRRDVQATLGGTLVIAGRSRQGLRELELAAEGARGAIAGKVRMRLGLSLLIIGQPVAAIPVLKVALADLREDPIWEARTRGALGFAELLIGNVGNATREVNESARLFRVASAPLEALVATENLGEIAVARGAISEGLRLYADVAAGYVTANQPVRFESVCGHANAYMAAGMPADAAALFTDYVVDDSLADLRRADLYYLRATARLASGETQDAIVDARRAKEMFRRQHRPWYHLRARHVIVRAHVAEGRQRAVATEARAVAEAMHAERATEAPLALTLAGICATGGDRVDLWQQAAAYRSHPNALSRAASWHAGALVGQEVGDTGVVLRAARAGMAAIDEHRRLMGSSELRALATTHGRDLAGIALRHAAHDPRILLRWSERTRATALAHPPATSDASTIPASLAALRENGRRLAEARQADEATEDLEKERLRLERAVRTEAHTVSAAETDPQRPVSPEEIVAGVGDGCLVELVDVDGTLHVLVVHHGRVRRKVAGTTAEVNELLGPAAMLLRRASRGRPANTKDLGQRLQNAILGDAARLIPDGPVTLAPTARLHGLAWPLLPALHDRPFGIVPSAGQWLRAREVRRPTPRRTLLVAGPALESGGAEVPVLARRHPDAVLLDGADATVTAVLEQLDGADLAHLATHGRFRADSPLFSSLDLADGPLTVHDLERLRRAPYRVVLSACESGVLAPVGAQELLGLAAALFSIGTAGLVSSVGEVNDAATAELMVGLHDALAQGDDPATALLAVRRAAVDDPVASGTAAAFVALGV